MPYHRKKTQNSSVHALSNFRTIMFSELLWCQRKSNTVMLMYDLQDRKSLRTDLSLSEPFIIDRFMISEIYIHPILKIHF